MGPWWFLSEENTKESRSSVYTFLISGSPYTGSIHGEAASETVRKLKNRPSACWCSGPGQLNIVHRLGDWHRVTHKCPRNGAAGIFCGTEDGRHACTSFPRLLIPTVRGVLRCWIHLASSHLRGPSRDRGLSHRQKCPPLVNPFSSFRHPVMLSNNKVFNYSISSPQSLSAGEALSP
jgi:hypothetical protein